MYFQRKEYKILEKGAIPRHIAIIMDGNGRWSELRGISRSEGHKRGAENVREIVKAALEIRLEILSLYAFSIENWMRPEDEISIIMDILESSLTEEFPNFMKEGIRFKVIGDRQRLHRGIRVLIEGIEEATANNNNLILQCALSYGGRDEIIRTVKKVLNLNLSTEDIDEKGISELLDTKGIPDPDLIIRTSGEQRVSNFLLWQSAYSEFYFTDTLWPDFTKEELIEAIYQYQLRNRRFGRVELGTIKCI